MKYLKETKLDKLALGKKIKRLRFDAELTQKQLAEKIGVSQNMISALEKGKTIMSVDTLISLCRVFDCSSDFLLGIDGSL